MFSRIYKFKVKIVSYSYLPLRHLRSATHTRDEADFPFPEFRVQPIWIPFPSEILKIFRIFWILSFFLWEFFYPRIPLPSRMLNPEFENPRTLPSPRVGPKSPPPYTRRLSLDHNVESRKFDSKIRPKENRKIRHQSPT